MKPYYKDELATIYNCTSFLFKSDIIVLDPPAPLVKATKFEAPVLYIFCGSNAEFYAGQFQDKYRSLVRWRTMPSDDSILKKVSNDLMLVIGQVTVPGKGEYYTESAKKSAGVWDRPIELFLNLLVESDGDVLDPFMGGGNSLVAAKKLGRKAIGFDTDERQCAIAAKRCEEC